jgi:hypothetical protein
MAFQICEHKTLGFSINAFSEVATSFVYILLGSREKIFCQGVQMENPNKKDCMIENTVFQIIYHKYVSKKKRIRYMHIIRTSVMIGIFVQRAEPTIASLQFEIRIFDMTLKESLKERAKKK